METRQQLKVVGKTALGFTAALVLFEALVFHQGYMGYFFYSGSRLRHVTVGSTLILFSYALTAIYIGASLTAKAWVRGLYLLLFALIVFLQYGYLHALGGFATADDLILVFSVWRNTSTAGALAVTYVRWLAVVPCIGYAALLWRVRSLRKTGVGTLAIAVAVLLLLNLPVTLLLLKPSRWLYRAYPTTSLAGFFRSSTEVGTWMVRLATRGEREPVSHVDVRQQPTNNIVFIVDESVRADHLGINGYGRPTTPTLDALGQDGLVTNWGVAVSGTNCSVSSNRLLWTGLPPTELPARDGQVWKWPNIAEYAHAMGYRTYLFDAHRVRGLWFNDSALPTDSLDLRDVDHWMLRDSFRGHADYDVDFALADQVGAIVDGSVGNFIWVNKAGVHPLYTNAYPPAAARWTPTETEFFEWRPSDLPVEPLRNAYDNAIRYNVDGFFSHLDPSHRRAGTVFVYTSDHGQSLSEQGEPWSHCSDLRGGATNRDREAMVPLLMIVSGSNARDVGPALDRASHANIFATLLDVMEVPGQIRSHNYWPSLLASDRFEIVPRYYFLGDEIEGQTPSGGVARFNEATLRKVAPGIAK